MSKLLVICDVGDPYEIPLASVTTKEAADWLNTTPDALLKRLKNGGGEAVYNSYKVVNIEL